MTDDRRKPDAAALVAQLDAAILHRVIDHQGLEACAALVGAATPDQLARVLDIDLWRPVRRGEDEELDAARFGTWLAVIAELGEEQGAARLADLDRHLLIAGLNEHVRVFDVAVVSEYTTLEGLQAVSVQAPQDTASVEVGGHLVTARRTDAWDAILRLLPALEAEQPACFEAVIAGCRRLSNSKPEADDLNDLLDRRAQQLFDASAARSDRRHAQGYVEPAEARAFLQMGRSAAAPSATTSVNPIVARHLARGGARVSGPNVPRMPPRSGPAATTALATNYTAIDALVETGLIEAPHDLSIPDQQPAGPSRLDALMAYLRDRHPQLFAVRTAELGFLANAMVAGCTFQHRGFTGPTAAQAVVATCSLGLENSQRSPAPDHLVGHDVIGIFHTGWKTVYDEVSMFVASELAALLSRTEVADRQTQAGLNTLRLALSRHLRAGTPWRASEALDALASLDVAVWTAIGGLLGECPILPAAMTSIVDRSPERIDPAAFEFIAERRQIGQIHRFLRLVPGLIAG